MCPDAKQLRLSSCIQTIMDVHASLCRNQFDPELLQRFEKLEQSLHLMGGDWISEADIKRVEEVTNTLLGELQPVFNRTLKAIHGGVKH